MLAALPLAAAGEDPPTVTMDEIVVTLHPTPGAARPDPADLAAQRAVTGDAAELLRSVPGLSLHGAGGISTSRSSTAWRTIASECWWTARN